MRSPHYRTFRKAVKEELSQYAPRSRSPTHVAEVYVVSLSCTVAAPDVEPAQELTGAIQQHILATRTGPTVQAAMRPVGTLVRIQRRYLFDIR